MLSKPEIISGEIGTNILRNDTDRKLPEGKLTSNIISKNPFIVKSLGLNGRFHVLTAVEQILTTHL